MLFSLFVGETKEKMDACPPILSSNLLLIALLYFSMTGVGGRPELIILGSNSLDGPWEVGFGAFHNTMLLCPKIRCFISQVDLIPNFRNTTSYTSPGIFINRPLLLVSFLQDCQLVTAL